MTSNSKESELTLLKDKHINFCLRCLKVLPQQCEFLDSTKLVAVYFSISTLDLLNALCKLGINKKKIIEWIYHLQLLPNELDSNCGFRGSMSCTVENSPIVNSYLYDQPNIAMTYTALCTLLILEDDFTHVNKKGILKSLRKLQHADGSFRALSDSSENDMRFVYCASCICYILKDWTGMDIEMAVCYIKNSMSYEGGIAQGPGLEAHGGSTFCAIASLWLMGKLEETFSPLDLKNLIRWCLLRQENGFQGRPNKPVDTCYTFWVGATLKLLNSYQFVDQSELSNYVLSSQDEVTGGISKWWDHTPDILHTYLGISGLSLMGIEGTSPVHPALNISERAATYLTKLHKKWT